MALISSVSLVHAILFVIVSSLLAQLGLSMDDGGGHNTFTLHGIDKWIIQVSLILGSILTLVLIFFIRRFCNKRQQPTPSIQLPNLPPSQVPETSTNPSNTLPETYVLRRLPEEIYRRFPVDTYSTERCNDFSHIDCMICNFSFVDGEELCILPVCRHVFHSHCTSSWFLNHDCRCTLCRHDYFDGFSDDQLV
ncbi:RING-H2 finger protein ATL39-like [Spinacia oleracea]|uniref:RING-H2 finger protein ATL39-like n=1 Tax=Spinacia oleracea TaxID=3562 RepID=A0A9R0K3G5_SPIOL|nr:RING-H2 finger protein ATL39-like [Spinacia oleracea]XP_056689092.1 RING-H2 finger protein ATL39-like [Spinacia oleracea]